VVVPKYTKVTRSGRRERTAPNQFTSSARHASSAEESDGAARTERRSLRSLGCLPPCLPVAEIISETLLLTSYQRLVRGVLGTNSAPAAGPADVVRVEIVRTCARQLRAAGADAEVVVIRATAPSDVDVYPHRRLAAVVVCRELGLADAVPEEAARGERARSRPDTCSTTTRVRPNDSADAAALP
jgi:hypothetical protein